MSSEHGAGVWDPLPVFLIKKGTGEREGVSPGNRGFPGSGRALDHSQGQRSCCPEPEPAVFLQFSQGTFFQANWGEMKCSSYLNKSDG